MPPRSSWKGFLKLSLVSVPVKAFTAGASGSEIRLNQLHRDCNNRIRYQKTCPEHGEVQADEIISGYEYAKGQYVVIDLDELSVLRTTDSDKSVRIDGFIPLDAIDPLYHAGRTYYILPDGVVGQKPYALLREAMLKDGVQAIAQVVIAGKEQLVLLRPMGKLLVMTLLNHDAKVKAPGEFEDELPDDAVAAEELALTTTLVEASKISEFDYKTYKDSYREKLGELIQAKVDGAELVQVPDAEEPKILNLMEALKASVAQAQLGTESEKPAAKGRKKMAPSSRSATITRKRKSG